jgi:hypothetical protein
MTYLNASGNASGKVNLPMPITAAPATILECGRTYDKNLASGVRRMSACSEFIGANFLLGGNFSGSIRQQQSLCPGREIAGLPRHIFR